MARTRKPSFLDPGYRAGSSPTADLFLFAEMLRGYILHVELVRETPAVAAAAIATETSLAFLNDPFRLPLDGLDALLTGDERQIDAFKLANVWLGGKSSLQLSLARDDRNRYSLVAVVDGAPVNGEPGRHGTLLYSCQEWYRSTKHGKLPGLDAVTAPLAAQGGLPGMTLDHSERSIQLALGRVTPEAYSRQRQRLGCDRMYVEVHHEIIAAAQKALADDTPIARAGLERAIREELVYADALPPDPRRAAIRSIQDTIGMTDEEMAHRLGSPL